MPRLCIIGIFAAAAVVSLVLWHNGPWSTKNPDNQVAATHEAEQQPVTVVAVNDDLSSKQAASVAAASNNNSLPEVTDDTIKETEQEDVITDQSSDNLKAHLAQLEQAFYQQPVDANWAATMEGRLQQEWGMIGNHEAKLLNRHCRQTSCRVEIDHAGNSSALIEQYCLSLQDIFSHWWRGDQQNEPNTGTAVIYLSRNKM